MIVRKPYSINEEQFILDNYRKMTCDEIGKHLSRSGPAIQHKARELGITREAWSDDEKRYLKRHYENTDMVVLMRELKRPYKSITTMANRMGLKRDLSVNCFYADRSFNGPKRSERPKPARPVIHVQKEKTKSLSRKKVEAKMASRPLNLQEKHPVRIDHKTVIYLSNSMSQEEASRVIKKYQRTA
ncbi:MAG: hypothetical protein ACT4OJ_04290 [Bacteroidota bacterium]